MLRKGDEPIPGYRLEEFLGRGQFGEVWRTTAPGGTSAALKFIDLSGTRGLKEFRGVQRVKEIRHAHLMPITALWMLDEDGNILGDRVVESYDPQETARDTLAPRIVDQSGQPGWLVVAMLLGDKNLLDRLEEQQRANEYGIPEDELLGYMEEAAKGIDFLNTPQHDLGEGPVAIQHCDIKPANIMLVGDSVVICDFGLARMLGDAAATATGMVGSPAYMAPECINRKPSHATDQYSLAVTYIELRTGQLPFEDEGYMAILDAHRQGALDLSGLESHEREVIRKATSVDPEERYSSALELVRALREATSSRAVRSVWRPMAVTAVVLVAVSLAAGAIAWKFFPFSKDTNGKNNVPGVIKDLTKKYKVVVEPEHETVTIEVQKQALSDAGEFEVDMTPDTPILVKVSTTDDDYAPIIGEPYTLSRLEGLGFRIELERSDSYRARNLATLAFEHLNSGDESAAVEKYKQAIELDGSLELPPPVDPLHHHSAGITNLAFSRAGSRLVSTGDDGTACTWPLRSPGEPPAAPVVLSGHEPDQTIEALALGAAGRWLVTGCWDGKALVWDLNAEDPNESPIPLSEPTEVNSEVVGVEIVIPGRRVVTATLDKLRLWDVRSEEAAASVKTLDEIAPTEPPIDKIVVSPDRRWLVSLDAEGGAQRWDLTTSDPSGKRLQDLRHQVKAYLVTPDSEWLITGGDDGRVVFTHLELPDERWELEGMEDDVESLVISPNGERLAAGGTDGTIRVWNVPDGKVSSPAQLLDGHVAEVVSLALSADGRWLLSGSWGGFVYLWDLEAENPSRSPLCLRGHGGTKIRSVVISQDDLWAASGDARGVILLWDLRTCIMIQKAIAELKPDAPGGTDA